MEHYTQEAVQDAIRVIASIIPRCEKAQAKFEEGTAQFSLLRNRIKALKIAKYLLENREEEAIYSVDDLKNALPPILSIIHKTETARSKHQEGSPLYRRLTPTLNAMYLSRDYIESELQQR